ncbi:zinc finger protein [Penicillium brevicompactum]
MSDPQWLWDPLFVCQMGPLQEEKTCCGITKKGDACKLVVKKETLKEGRQRLSNLARSPFDLSTLDSQLNGIVSFFLCKKWHRSRQQSDVKQRWFDAAVRNQTQAQTSSHRGFSPSTAEVSDSQERLQGSFETEALYDLMLEFDEIDYPEFTTPTRMGSSQPSGREVTVHMLTTNGVRWDVSPDDPAILSVRNEYGRVRSIQLHAFRQGSCPDSEMCPICFEEVSDSPIILQCDTCKGVVHLECMEGWLAHRLRRNRTSCPIHRCNGSFTALLSSSLAGNATSESTIEECPEDTGTLAGGPAAPTALSQRGSPPLARRSTRSPVSGASSPSLSRRSARSRRVPDRFRP